MVRIADKRTLQLAEGRFRLFPGDIAVGLGGKLGLIYPMEDFPDLKPHIEVLRIVKSGAYLVTFGDAWILFKPHRRHGKLIRAHNANGHFGDILVPGTFDPVVQYDVTFSKGVEEVEGGWKFVDAEGATVGLFLTDLFLRFGSRGRKTSGQVEIDLTGVEPDERGEINLDPGTQITADALGKKYITKFVPMTLPTVESDFDDAWDLAHGWPSGINLSATGPGVKSYCYGTFSPDYARASITRSAAQFDTSGYPTPYSAILQVSFGTETMSPTIRAGAISTADVTDGAMYADCLDTWDDWGEATRTGGAGTYYYRWDILSRWGDWSGVASQVGFREGHDVSNVRPGYSEGMHSISSGNVHIDIAWGCPRQAHHNRHRRIA